jgi:multisubunit Na+/H+ antiporter MnhG subunit
MKVALFTELVTPLAFATLAAVALLRVPGRNEIAHAKKKVSTALNVFLILTALTFFLLINCL